MTSSVPIDLRSDTVTQPSQEMLAAMTSAPVGDDVYHEDPTVNALEERVAALLGHEAGVFTPTGSMANQLGLRLHVQPGAELLAEASAHVLRAELGAAAALSGITTRNWRGVHGLADPAEITPLIAPRSSPYLVATSAIAVENTHNFGGGTVQPIEMLREVRALADANGLTLHLDGARLWNAHVATGVALGDYGNLFDTVSVCFSKGLGAPVGSMLVGPAAWIEQARVWRKRLGGGMRQVGLLAAAADYALEHHLDGLAADHEHATVLAGAIATAAPAVTDPAQAHTNIVMLDLTTARTDAASLEAAASEQGVRISVLGPNVARLVTHRDLSRSQINQAAEVLAGLLARSV